MPINLGAKKQVNYLEFDGVNDYVEIQNYTGMEPLNDDFSVEANIYINNLGNDMTIYAHEVLGGPGFDFRILPDGKLRCLISATNTGNRNERTFRDSSTTLQTNTWYNVKLEFINSSGTINFYIDDVLSNGSYGDTNFSNGSSFSPNIEPSIGYRKTTSTRFLNGFIRNFKFSKNNTLVTEYLFDEGSGTTLNDNVGNNDGTIFGATWGFDLVDNITNIYKGEVRDGFALEFDGVNDYVNFGNTFNSFDFEFELELEILNLTINERIFSKGDLANTQRQFVLLITNTNQFRFIIYGPNFSNRYEVFFTHNQNFNDLGKFTLTASFDGTNQNGLSVKINNVELSKSVSSFGSPNLQAFNTDFNLFSDFEGNGNYLNGILYSFKVKQNGMLVSQYNLTEGSGTTLTDSIENNDGTIVGADWVAIGKIPANENSAVIKRIWLGDNNLVFGKTENS